MSQININTRERALSRDVNRLQAFVAKDRQEILRALLDDARNFYALPGISVPSDAVSAPLRAAVLTGLMVQPDLPASLLVQGGRLCAVFPAPSPDPDDSPYVFVDDPGVQAAGVLNFSANPGPGARIDVVECQPVETVLEVDNRDVFDPSAGTWTTVAAAKTVAARLAYRIRQGTPGAGYPGHASGWLPLAVASVPVGAVDFTGVTFWDVRPLAADRIGIFNDSAQWPHRRRLQVYGDRWTNPAELRIQGIADLEFGAYRVGGQLAKTTPTASMGAGDVQYVDALNPENQSPGFAPGLGVPWYLVALFPHGLPRWARYSEAALAPPTIGRAPQGPRGIHCVTTSDSATSSGLYSGVLPPASTGLLSPSPGILVAASASDRTVAFPGAGSLKGISCVDRLIQFSDGASGFEGGIDVPPIFLASNLAIFELVPGTHVPSCAKSVRLRLSASGTGTASSFFQLIRVVQLADAAGNQLTTVHREQSSDWRTSAGGDFFDGCVLDVPLRNLPPGAPTNHQVRVFWNISGGPPVTVSSASLMVYGWEIGP